METRNDTLNAVREWLELDQWRFRMEEDGTSIETGFRGESGLFRIRVFTGQQLPVLVIIVQMSLTVPEDRRLAVAEAMSRINFAMGLGCFEIDMNDGMIGFRASMPIADATLSQEQFRCLFYVSCSTVSRYYRAFCRLVYADDLSAAEAVAEIEMAGGPKEAKE